MINLRGIVYGQYKSIADLARALGWTRQKTTRIINMKQEPSLDDVKSLSVALNKSFDDVAEFFLQTQSHKCD